MQVLLFYGLGHGFGDNLSDGLHLGEVVPQEVGTALIQEQEEVPEERQLPPYQGWSTNPKWRKSM